MAVLLHQAALEEPSHGPSHPLGWDSGGSPDGPHAVTAEHQGGDDTQPVAVGEQREDAVDGWFIGHARHHAAAEPVVPDSATQSFRRVPRR